MRFHLVCGVLVASLFTVASVASMAFPAAPPPATRSAATAPATAPAALIRDAYPDLAFSGLIHARLAELPAGTVLKAGELSITEKEIADQIADAPKEVQNQLKKNAFFVLEQMATKRLLVSEAKAQAGGAGKDAPSDEHTLMQGYLVKFVESVKISDEEIAQFYKANQDAVGGADLDKVKRQISGYLRNQKEQELVAQQVRTLGQRTTIEVSSAWAKAQAVLAKDNPVDKARASGKPSLVDFGSKGCRPCDMLAPILEELKTKYGAKANVLFVSVVEEQILAARYGIEAIPVQVFFDKDGKEVFRHVGFFPQDEIEAQMTKMGVK